MGTLRFPILGLGITQCRLLYPARSCSELRELFREADSPHVPHVLPHPLQLNPSRKDNGKFLCHFCTIQASPYSVKYCAQYPSSSCSRCCCSKKSCGKDEFSPPTQWQGHWFFASCFFMYREEEQTVLKLKIILCINSQNCWGFCFRNFTSHCFRHNLNIENLSPTTLTRQKTHALQNCW